MHAELQRRAEHRGQSLQQYLAAELARLAARPPLEEVLSRISARRGGRVGLAQARSRHRRGPQPRLIVVDASVLANVLADDGPDGSLARDRVARGGELSAPDLVDTQTMSVLRKRWLARGLTARRFASAVDDLEALDLARYPALPLMRRGFEVRSNITAYDAAYVALAEGLGCPLLTADARLARSPGIRCQVEVLQGRAIE